MHIRLYGPHLIFEHDIESARQKRNENLKGKEKNVKVLLTMLIIYSKLVNLTYHSEVLLGLITCLWRSGTYLRLLASGSSKIESD